MEKETLLKSTALRLFRIAKTILFSFIIYFVSLPILNGIFREELQAMDFTPIYLCWIPMYAVAFWLGYLWQRKYETLDGTGTVIHTTTPKLSHRVVILGAEKTAIATNEIAKRLSLSEFIKGDGKHLYIIYGILAILNEVALSVGFVSLSTLLATTFPLSQIFPFPIIRTVIAYLVTMIMLTVLCIIKNRISVKKRKY